MNSHNGETENPYILKREGRFIEALQLYADKCQKAHNERNEFIAQVCFDQMVDAQLLELLRENRSFRRLRDLELEVSNHLKQVVSEWANLDEHFQQYFENSWGKFDRRGRPLLSVRREQLIISKSDNQGHLRLTD